MRTILNLLRRSVLLLPLLVFLILPNTYTTGTTVRITQFSESDCVLDVDGTQLVNETKQVVADFLHISPSVVSASYCCLLLDGRYKYSASTGTQQGFVYWTIVNGQIIEDNIEGF